MATTTYNLRNIRTLLEEFTDEELRRLCYDMPNFRLVYDRLAPDTSKAEIIDRLIEYAERTSQLETLLGLISELNPTQYAKHQPYGGVADSINAPPNSSRAAQTKGQSVAEVPPAPEPMDVAQHAVDVNEPSSSSSLDPSENAPPMSDTELTELYQRVKTKFTAYAKGERPPMSDTELKDLLVTLNSNLNILHEREAKFGGAAPLTLLNQLDDYRQAIGLVESRLANQISDEALEEGLARLNLALAETEEGRVYPWGNDFVDDAPNKPSEQAAPTSERPEEKILKAKIVSATPLMPKPLLRFSPANIPVLP
jgi:hypothetical protein